MTFYNYELINRSTFTLTDTYFGQWVDADLGNSSDDYVGCDAERGLGYCYNGDGDDENTGGVVGYGQTPPAIGVDFFQGPYADFDGIDNPLTQVVQDAIDSNGIPYPGLGIGYGDGIVDNERYGMRKFVFYNIGDGRLGDPTSALDHYNYLRGIWRDGTQMVWGGDGNIQSGGSVPADILFPGVSDPLNWSTQGIAVDPNWSEFDEGNQPGDRRFLQSAGPFTLEPGAVNDITVGVVFARANSGDNFASISALTVADDKAQSLFDNCFKIVEGPDAPNLSFQELNNEIIIYLENPKSSNNFNESYYVKNPAISIPDTLDGVYQGSEEDKDTLKYYDFQGYQIFQVKNASVTVNEIYNVDNARLLAQVDIKDGVTDIINYNYNNDFDIVVPALMVEGEDKGIKHSFRVTTDLFATGDNRLINHKTYYYIAIAYGYNQYKRYDGNTPQGLDGQKLPYIASRKAANGSGISSYSAIPHDPSPENGGTQLNSQYGDNPQIIRVEGQGNGGNELDLTSATETFIIENSFSDNLVYRAGKGPIQVKVIDPLNVKTGTYRVQFKDTTTIGDLSDSFWTLHLPNGDSINSDQTIELENEQIFVDEGIAITIKSTKGPGQDVNFGNGYITSEVIYSDPSKPWLGGFRDRDVQSDVNWIRSGESLYGTGSSPSYTPTEYDDYHQGLIASPGDFIDPSQDFENVINGTWAPYRLVSSPSNPGTDATIKDALAYKPLRFGSSYLETYKSSDISKTPSIDIVFTSDKSKWSRAVVLESRNSKLLSIGEANFLRPRQSLSVGKDGNPDGEKNSDGSDKKGLGWFPGYAINIETGQRLNIAFAEDSWLAGENGRDMLWNPTSNSFGGVDNELLLGGKHYVYIFNADKVGTVEYPAYDESKFIYDIMNKPHNDDPNTTASSANGNNAIASADLFSNTCVWAGIPMLNDGFEILDSDARIRIRVSKPYASYETASLVNNGLPMYEFNMSGLEVELGNKSVMESALDLINVVPNPYFAYSEYETAALDKRIKITNLPEVCTISIYNVGGTLMRRFNKSDDKTSLEWELTNQVDVPVSTGLYLIHVDVPGIGERTIKWYGVMKPTDLNNFN